MSRAVPPRSVARSPERLVQAGGLTLCCQTFGVPQHPALLLIMGMGAQMVGWDDDFCVQLAQRGFHVVRFDNRDAGRSTRFDDAGTPDVASAMMRAWMRLPVPAPYLLRDMAHDAVGLLDALGIARAHLVGASMGGAIAQLLAVHHRERVLSLTSIMSTTGARDLPAPDATAMNALFRPTPLELAAYTEHYLKTWRVMRGGAFPEEDERDRARAACNHARGLNPAGAARQLAAILASGSRREALRGVSVPALVVHGDADPLVPLAAGVDTARSIPGARLLVLEGMGHSLPLRMWPRIVDGIAEIAGIAGIAGGPAGAGPRR
ncbi:MAG: alpha/beta fold hydrolase [Proteobacteria bacterium]|nr:alpha/beta fold hydrolase [Pseudomonadota bacterium]